jgi:hypothetical protein
VSEPTIVCVLGMHRSGTSLVARVLNLLGLDLGPEEHLMRPGPANPAGHWESRAIKEINDEILLRLGGSWSEPPELAAGWERKPELAELRRQARELIEADFSGSDLWGFKDPRNSLTLPFWQRILGPMRYVICLRNPVDVAASLEVREDEPVPFEQGIGLWLTYVRVALGATAGHRQQLVFYEDLMADPGPVVQRLARFIGRHKTAAEPEVRGAIGVVASENLWHHRTAVPNVVDASRLAFHVKALYLALRLFVPGPENVGTDALDLLGAYAADAGRRLAELEAGQAELEKSRERSRTLNRRRVALERRLSERRADLERIRQEHSEEKRLRREFEAELAASRTEERRLRSELEVTRAEEARRRRELDAELGTTRAELSRLEAATRDSASETDEGPGAAAVPSGTHPRLVAEIQARAQELIPSGAIVLVAAKGEHALLQLEGSRGWHFPLGADGRYAGDHPAGDTAVIAQLEALRARGANHLLLPATTLWWLDHYRGLRRHLEDRYVPLLEDEHCAIYRLSAEERRHVTGPIATLRRTVACVRTRFGRDPSILDWRTELEIADHAPGLRVFVPPGEEPALPYLDGTVDIVVLASEDAARIAEARRVAATAVIRVDPNSTERAELEWLAGGPSGWGEDVSVTLIPDATGPHWDATVAAVAETLDDGFAGELRLVGDPAALGPASERAAAAGARVRPIEVAAGANLAQRARAASEATDQPVQVFVAAPSVPLPGWLPSIRALFSGDRNPGVVGTRIVSRFGALEEAGGILAADGSRRRRGEGDSNPDRPEYRFVQPVDFCSPPLLATRGDLFDRLGGFREGPVTPADAVVDFSLRAGRTGAPVYYQPHARVVTLGDGSP